MGWWSGAGRFWRGPRIEITGRWYLVMALWLLVLPLQWVGAMVLAAAIHELGHLIALWLWGIPVWRVELDGTGARMDVGPMEPEEELVCALAGPLAGAMVCLFWRWLPRTALVAGIQTLFNLIPVKPLDGGRMLASARNICCKVKEKRVQ